MVGLLVARRGALYRSRMNYVHASYRGSSRLAVAGALIALLGFIAPASQLATSSSPAGAASIPVCQARGLQVTVLFNEPGNPFGAITFVNNNSRPCSLSGRPTIRVFTKSGRALALKESLDDLTPPLPRPAGPVVLTSKEPWAVVEMDWCGFQSAYSRISIRFSGWTKALNERAAAFGPESYVPPSCAHSSSSLLAIDYVRNLGAKGIAGSTPVVRVLPSRDLHNGEKVLVRVSGFAIGMKFWMSECATGSDVHKDGCGSQLAAQPFGLTDLSGAGSYSFIVRTSAATSPYNAKLRRSCTAQCVLMVTDAANLAYIPLTFATP